MRLRVPRKSAQRCAGCDQDRRRKEEEQHSLQICVNAFDEANFGGFFQGDLMFKNAFVEKKSERLGLFLAMVIFALVAMVHLHRALAGLSLELGSYSLPSWFSVVVGICALTFAVWMAAILRTRRHKDLLLPTTGQGRTIQ
jgi:hypothetical protein